MKHVNIKIFGRVQGVGFRFNAKRRADDLDIKGFVENKSDGSVYIEAEGDKENITTFINWCESGPSFARVKRIEEDPGEIQDFDGFKIKY